MTEEGEERKEKRKERERERKGEERKVGVPTYEQSSRDTPKKERGDPEYFNQENPRKIQKAKRERGREGGEGGLSSPQVPMNLKLALTAVVTLCPAEMAGCFDRCGHMSQLGIPKMRQTSHFLRHEPTAARSGHLHLQSKGDNDKPPFDGSTGGTLRKRGK